jgi:uncharacterized protein YerC
LRIEQRTRDALAKATLSAKDRAAAEAYVDALSTITHYAALHQGVVIEALAAAVGRES